MTAALFSPLAVLPVFMLAGFPAHVLATPRLLRGRGLEPWLCAFWGFSLLPLCGAYALALGLPVKYAFYLFFGISAALWLRLLFFRRQALAAELLALRDAFASWRAGRALAAVGIAALLLSPQYGAGTPFRFGPDIAQYCGMAQFLLDGGTLPALRGIDTAVNTGASVLVQSFLQYFRWGVSVELAFAAWLFGGAGAAATAFPLLLVPYALACVFVFELLRRHVPAAAAFWLACAFALNGNLINVYYESFWAQVCALPGVLYVFLALARLREDVQWEQRELFSGALVVASLAVLYSESAIFLLPALIFLMLCLDLLSGFGLGWFWRSLACFGLGLAILLPCLPWLCASVFCSTSAIGQGGGAWQQPLWAWPSEMLGFTSIYGKLYCIGQPLRYNAMIERCLPDAFLNAAVSLAAVWLAFSWFRRAGKSLRNFYLAPVLLTLAALAFLLLRGSHNYLYFKVYTLFLPLFLALAAAAWPSGEGTLFYKWRGAALSVFAACVFFSGALTVRQYAAQRGFIGDRLSGLHAFVGREVLLKPTRWDGALFVNSAPAQGGGTPLPHPAEHAMFNIMRVNWLNSQALSSPQSVRPFLGYRALLLLDAGQAAKARILPPGKILYSDAYYTLFDSGRDASFFLLPPPLAAPYFNFSPTFSPA
ncbi:MAG: hypothetical protein GX410_05365 [Elusimicrobia bacterium]|nr:hypothetical protein [Elusimicrobiota bacterium]